MRKKKSQGEEERDRFNSGLDACNGQQERWSLALKGKWQAAHKRRFSIRSEARIYHSMLYRMSELSASILMLIILLSNTDGARRSSLDSRCYLVQGSIAQGTCRLTTGSSREGHKTYVEFQARK